MTRITQNAKFWTYPFLKNYSSNVSSISFIFILVKIRRVMPLKLAERVKNLFIIIEWNPRLFHFFLLFFQRSIENFQRKFTYFCSLDMRSNVWVLLTKYVTVIRSYFCSLHPHWLKSSFMSIIALLSVRQWYTVLFIRIPRLYENFWTRFISPN